MTITATELKTNLHKYLILSQSEDVYVTTNGRIVTKLSNPFNDKAESVKKVFGILSSDISLEEDEKDMFKKV